MVGGTRNAADGIEEASETEAISVKTQAPDNHSHSGSEKNDDSSELATNMQGNAQPVDHAIEKVKAIPELMEAILSHLEFADLLVTTRVSKDFKDFIDKSPTLQKNLFLLPIRGAAPTARFYPDRHNNKHLDSDSNYDLPFTITKVCPLLRRKRGPSYNLAERSTWGCVGNGADFYIKNAAVLAEPWVNMYLTIPPVTKVLVQFRREAPSSCYVYADRIVEQEGGVTFASLLTAAHMDGDVIITSRMFGVFERKKTDTTFHRNFKGHCHGDYDQNMRAAWLDTSITILDNVIFPTELELAELYSEMEGGVETDEQSDEKKSNVYCPKVGKWALVQRPSDSRLNASTVLDYQE